MAATTDEPTDPMILHRASGAEKLHRIFIFVGNRAHLVQEFLLAVLLLTAAPAFGWEHWGGDRGATPVSPHDHDVPPQFEQPVRPRKLLRRMHDTNPASTRKQQLFFAS